MPGVPDEIRGPGSRLIAIGWLRGAFRESGIHLDQSE
jgi:hypothetical protein